MAPTSYVLHTGYDQEPISRTYQYRKVMKPMLERKRRARINRCLDELKELMVTTLQSEGENVSKLEKADILELTVRHLYTLKKQHRLVAEPETSYADRFKAGFSLCAKEVSNYLVNMVEPVASARLLQHLGGCIRQLDTVSTTEVSYRSTYSPPISPPTVVSVNKDVWRPW